MQLVKCLLRFYNNDNNRHRDSWTKRNASRKSCVHCAHYLKQPIGKNFQVADKKNPKNYPKSTGYLISKALPKTTTIGIPPSSYICVGQNAMHSRKCRVYWALTVKTRQKTLLT